MTQVTRAYWILLAIFLAAVAVHVLFLDGGLHSLAHRDEYVYDQAVTVTGAIGEVRLSMYVPAPGTGIEIREESFETADLDLQLRDGEDGRLLELSGPSVGAGSSLRYRGIVRTRRVEYHLDPDLSWAGVEADSAHVANSPGIQVGSDPIAERLALIFSLPDSVARPGPGRPEQEVWQGFLAAHGVGPVEAVKRIHDHCLNDILPAEFSGRTDALTALRLGESSCGGKSRLMTALSRRLGLPARIAGGVILGQPGRSRAHHLWVEVLLGDAWVPFDPLNGHAAVRPARYLPLYRGDLPLIRHSRGLSTDYGFASSRRTVPLIWLGTPPGGPEVGEGRTPIIPILDQGNFSALLLAPFALLLIVFARQVVGIDSIGTFLPILMGFSLIQAGWLVVGIQMALAVALGVLARYMLTRLNLLHVPRTAVLISTMVLAFMVFSVGVQRLDSAGGLGAAILPMAALAMAVEKFTIVAMDVGTRAALGLLLQTILLAAGCRAILITPFFQNLTIAFPEIIVLVMAMIIITGSHRGLRWRERWRFRHLRGEGSS